MPGNVGLGGFGQTPTPRAPGDGDSLPVTWIKRVGGALIPDVVRDAVKETAEFDRHLYSTYIARPISTALLFGNQTYLGNYENEHHQGQSLADTWRFVQDTYNETGDENGDGAGVSPGQSAVSLLANLGTDIGRPLGTEYEGEKTAILDPTTAKATAQFHESRWLKYTSGYGDLLLNWYADPLVIAGRGLGAANKTYGGVGHIDQAKEVQRAQNMTDAGIRREFTGPVVTPSQALLKPFIANASVPEVAAAAWAGTRDVADRQLIWRTMANDKSAWDALKAKHASIAEELEAAKGATTHADQEVHDYLNLVSTVPHPGGALQDMEWLGSISEIGKVIGKNDPAFMTLAEHATQTRAVAEDLVARDKWLTAALGTDEAPSGLLGAAKTQSIARSTALQAMRERRLATNSRLTNGYWVEKYGENTSRGRAMRLVKWMGGYTPTGWIATSGELVAGSHSDLRAFLIQGKASVEDQAKWMDEWAQAANPAERLEVAGRVEDTLFRQNAEAYGYTVEQANDLLTKTKLARTTARDQFKKDPTLVHDDGSVSLTALDLARLEEQTPLLNFKLIREAMDSDQRAVRASNASTMARLEDRGLNYWHTADSVLSGFNLIWKPTVLLRLGYTGRNVGESLVASFVRTGAMVADPLTGALHVAEQLPQRFARRLAMPGRRADLREIDDQMLYHTEERAHWQAQVTTVDKDIAFRQTFLEGRAAKDRAVTEREAAAEAKAAEGGRKVPRTPAAIHADEARKIAKFGAQQDRTIVRSTAARDNAQRSLSRARKRKSETPEEFEARRQISRDQIAEHNDKIAKAEAAKSTLPARIARNDLRGQKVAEANRAAEVEDVVVTHAKTEIGTLRTKREAAQVHLATIEEDIEQLRTWLADLSDLSIKKKRTGSSERTVAGIAHRGAMDEKMRAITERLVSGDRTTRMAVRNAESEQMTADHLRSRLEPTGARKIETSDPAYYPSLAGIINNEFRETPWMRDLMAGKDPADVADWLRTTPEGRKVIQANRWDDDVIDGQVLNMKALIENYLPDTELRVRAATEDVSPNFVRARLAGREDVVQIHGREVREVAGYLGKGDARGALERYENFIQRAFHFLGTMPEDAGARFPLYNHLYNDSMERAILANSDALHAMGQVELNETIGLFEQASRAHALAEVRRTIYTIERRHNVAVAARYVSPFLGVTINRFGFYGRMAVEQPRNTARLFLAYNAIHTVTDIYGQEQIPVTLPGPVAKALAILPGSQFDGLTDGPVELNLSKRSLNLIGQGSPWWNPGFGPPVTVPVAALSRNAGEDPNWLENLVIPYGSGHSVLDQVLPNTVQKWWDTHRSTAEWGKDFSMTGAYETYRASGGMRPMPTHDEIAKRADALGWIRFLSAAASPVASAPRNPLQTQADYMKQMRDLDHKNGTNNADAEFLAKYPDYFDFMVAQTKNPYGVDPVHASVERQKTHSDLLSAVISAGGDTSIAGLIVDDPDKVGGYDSTAFNWQKANPLFAGAGGSTRPTLALDEALRSREESHGWIEFNKVDVDIKEMLKARGLTSTSQSGAQDLAALKSSIVDKIAADYPAWGDAFQQRDGSYYSRNARSFVAIAADDKMYDDPIVGRWLPQAVQYLTLRQDITDMLAERAKAGGSDTFSAQSNSDLQQIWAATTTKMSASNPAWADVFSRYFDNDNMIPAGVTY